MLLTQAQAKKKLRAATGLSVKACQSIIASMPKVEDGCRLKVNDYHVKNAIREATEPVVAPPANVLRAGRRFSPRLVQKIKATAR